MPPQWREGLIVNLFKKGDPGNYRGITLLSVVGKVFCKVLIERLVKYLDRGQVFHEGQAGFRVKPGVLPGVTTGLGKCEGLCGKAGASINSFNCISLSVFWVCGRWPWCYGCCMSYQLSFKVVLLGGMWRIKLTVQALLGRKQI